jgi:hypothetical protein
VDKVATAAIKVCSALAGAWLALAVYFIACDQPQPEIRHAPVALERTFKAAQLVDSLTWIYPTPDAYFVPGKIYSMPLEWNAIPFIVEDSTSYRLLWTASGDSLPQIIGMFDSEINGLLWYVIKGMRAGDDFQLDPEGVKDDTLGTD